MKLGQVYRYTMFYCVTRLHVRVCMWTETGEPGALVEEWEHRCERPVTMQSHEHDMIVGVLAARGYEHLSHLEVMRAGKNLLISRWPYVAAVKLIDQEAPWGEFFFPTSLARVVQH